MVAQNKENNLISIDDIIFRAKSRGVDFGKGDARERLRYLTKIGLLPHAKRKSFNGQPPNGAYPEYVIELLVEIDEKIKAGKSIQELKKEKEREAWVKTPYTIYPPTLEVPLTSVKVPPFLPSVEVAETKQRQFLVGKIFKVFKVASFVLIVGLIVGAAVFFFSTQEAIKQDFYSYLLASFNWVRKLVQAPPAPVGERPETREIFLPVSPEPYLTINAETDINAPLNVKEQITAPSLSLLKGEFRATLSSADLAADRTYTFPNLSGIVCLTTGNCFGLGGEVFSAGGTPNRLAKFITSNEIADSSIEDLYPGVALTIDANGRVGIGTRNPRYSLQVAGRIQASGDICTNLAGGRCLSTLPLGGAPPAAAPTVVTAGIGGSGTTNYLPLWTAGTTLGDSIISQSGSIIEVDGTVSMLSFQLPTGAQAGYILTSDASGLGTWQPAPTGTLPVGIAGQTLRHDGTNWMADSFLYNSGNAIGIGTTTTPATLTLSGDAIFATTTLPQLVLKYDDNNYLRFAINGEQSLIESSKKFVINSLTGEVALTSNVSDFYATSTKIWGATFASAANDSTVRKSGELVFRASVPIFRFSVPGQTTSTDYVIVSKTFSSAESLTSITPTQLAGTSRVYAFLINFADNIAPTSSSTWRIFKPVAGTTYSTFSFSGQNLASLETGNPYLTATTTLPGDNDWQLEVSVPSTDRSIRIFNLFLLVFDEIN